MCVKCGKIDLTNARKIRNFALWISVISLSSDSRGIKEHRGGKPKPAPTFKGSSMTIWTYTVTCNHCFSHFTYDSVERDPLLKCPYCLSIDLKSKENETNDEDPEEFDKHCEDLGL